MVAAGPVRARLMPASTVRVSTGPTGDALMPRGVAAVDCGTNSLRLLVADVDPGRGQITDVARRMEIVRLGQGVDRTGRLALEALERTMAVLRDYADVIAGSAG